ncbi:hypothetical protein AAFF_G00128660 [Aldrovandia affinis]|uniref:Uncharacterized protein n=1 Tax=Aldrovandia affinis TaxID=143900 RepID=A0AAD7WXD5_9TELE|nr:hypothetical protein AAFF_G00128660 [Aldrovandia affinis]
MQSKESSPHHWACYQTGTAELVFILRWPSLDRDCALLALCEAATLASGVQQCGCPASSYQRSLDLGAALPVSVLIHMPFFT